MFDAFEVIVDNSNYPILVISESFEKVVETVDDTCHIVSITRIPKYNGNILIQVG